MDMMAIRRRVLLGGKKVIDTSPKVAEYGKSCAYANTGEQNMPTYCITEWYAFDPKQKGTIILYYFINGSSMPKFSNYQYSGFTDSNIRRNDWFYNSSSTNITRRIGWSDYTLDQIRFSIRIADIDYVYAYAKETGQIFFAGENTPYYGYTNINDMPT